MWVVVLLAACTGPETRPGDDRPEDSGPWSSPPTDRFAILSFPITCDRQTVEVEVQVGAASFAAPVPTRCDGVSTEEVAAARGAMEESCLAAGEPANLCAGAATDLAAELDKIALRRPVASATFDPADPEALPIEGSAADLLLAFADGTSETWTNRTTSWGERYLRLEADGAVIAQGARLWQVSPGPALGCGAERDHTIAGAIPAAGEISLDFHEVSELTCAAGVAMVLDVHMVAVDTGRR